MGTGGDPVQTLTGSFTYTRTDAAIPGLGPSPTFSRTYNSLDSRSGVLGPGWTHSYAMRVRRPLGDTSGDLLLIGPKGRSDRYDYNASTGTHTSPAGVLTRLIRSPDGGFIAQHPDRSSWTFDASGNLTRITDRHGNHSDLTYDGSGRLSTISDPAGRGALTLTYDGNGRLWKVTDWLTSARVVEYAYDTNTPSRLRTVKDREGNVTTYGYDGTSQRLVTITDANGHVAITMTYDGQGRVATQKDARGLASGQQYTFAYVTNGDGTKTTTVTMPPTSHESSWSPTMADTYDTQGRLIRRVTKPTSSSADDMTVELGYDADWNVVSYRDGRGNVTTFCYDVDEAGVAIPGSRANPTRRIEPAPSSGANRPVTLVAYDVNRNVVRVVPPNGVTSSASVTCSTDLTSSPYAIDATYATTFAYDATGTRLTSATQTFTDPELGAKTATTTLEYHPTLAGQITKVVTPRGNELSDPTYARTFSYYTDAARNGQMQTVTDALGSTTLDYDGVGRTTQVTAPNGHAWTHAYDAEDRVTALSAPGPQAGDPPLVTSVTYDDVGNAIKVVDPNGQITRYLYDAQDGLLEVWESPNAWTSANESSPSPKYVTAYQYDHNGNLARAIRAQGDTTYERAAEYTFDGLGRVRAEKQYPSWPNTGGALVTQVSYDANGNGVTLVDPLGQTTTFTYDILNRLTGLSFVDGTAAIGYAYDANGNRTQMTDGTGTTGYSYDQRDYLRSVTLPGPRTVGYRYDTNGNRRKLIYPDSTAVTYGYNKADHLISLTDWASRVTGFEYEPDGLLKTQTNFNGTKTTYAYDRARRLTDVWNQRGTDTISRHMFTLDKVGNRLTATELLAPLAPGPLQPAPGGLPTGHGGTASTAPGGLPAGHGGTASTAPTGLPNRPGPGSSSQTLTYTYDGLYRLTGATGAGASLAYTYDPIGNRLTMTRGSTTTTYAYDKLDRITSAVSPTGGTSYTVNASGNTTARGSDTFAFDQLNRMKQSAVAGASATYAYDGDGVRVGQTIGSSTTTYTHDVALGLPVVLDDGARKYVWGLGLAYAVTAAGGAVDVYHTDGLGSIRALTDASGTITQTYEYDAYGNLSLANGTRSQPFGYTGEPRDPTGLVHLRARMYDPAIGRFLQRDRFAGGATSPVSLHRFAYAHDNPVNNVDPSGLYTAAFCLNGDFGLGVYATGSLCPIAVSIDQRTWRYQYGTILAGGPGGTTGFAGGVTAGVQVTNARFLEDTSGWSDAVGGSVRALRSVGVDFVFGQDPRGEAYQGTSLSFGTGLAFTFVPVELPFVEVHTNTTFTRVFKFFDSLSLDDARRRRMKSQISR